MGQSSRESKQRYLQTHPEKRSQTCRDWRLRRFYGITSEEVKQEIEKNGNRCPICLREFTSESGTKPHVEHDHESGWFRGVVCENCNHGLGVFHDDIEAMQRAIEYLISNSPPTEFNIGAARAALKLPRNKPHGKHLENIKSAMRGNTFRQGLPAWNKGKAWSDETRKKMSESAKRRCESIEQRAALALAAAKGAEVRWGKRG